MFSHCQFIYFFPKKNYVSNIIIVRTVLEGLLDSKSTAKVGKGISSIATWQTSIHVLLSRKKKSDRQFFLLEDFVPHKWKKVDSQKIWSFFVERVCICASFGKLFKLWICVLDLHPDNISWGYFRIFYHTLPYFYSFFRKNYSSACLFGFATNCIQNCTIWATAGL